MAHSTLGSSGAGTAVSVAHDSSTTGSFAIVNATDASVTLTINNGSDSNTITLPSVGGVVQGKSYLKDPSTLSFTSTEATFPAGGVMIVQTSGAASTINLTNIQARHATVATENQRIWLSSSTL